MSLSVAIITFNEERHIGRCLDSVRGIADEIVVVDSGSTDRTAEICRSHGASVTVHPFEGHIQQKNVALALCSSDFVLSLDADEALSDQLRTSIAATMTQWNADAYEMNRCTNYCGTWVRHGGWYPDRKVRLFRRSKGAWTGTNPHDRFELADPRAKVGRLAGDILHYSYENLGEHLRQIDSFTRISATELAAGGHRAGLWRLVVSPVFRFVRDYVLRLGFLDGYHGFIIAALSSAAVFVKYARVRERIQKDRPDGT